jgi:hypothetical protein
MSIFRTLPAAEFLEFLEGDQDDHAFSPTGSSTRYARVRHQPTIGVIS